MVSRIIIVDAAGQVLYLADWQHADRLEPFILGNLPDGGYAYAVTIRTAAHFVDFEVPQAKRKAHHAAMLRSAREPAVRAFLGAAHRIQLATTRGSDGLLHAYGAYANKSEDNGVISSKSRIAMPDEVIDGRPRPLFRRDGADFLRWQRGAWVRHESDHVRHIRLAWEGSTP